ncbi:uncharacterized protein M421DRAFT_273905 [Didymella exigua CBS 183.55]|uniref:Uncharacterized protein n=1 Tax=Didymella exigua CBS 183.55 TaxID=1150837 RepID=A0A6A5R8W2_9PLEO|nr:uncharacterized protein M421DRAFT_273905 [Didymella exigua CBS 183.55]KAF1924665.1 hypothetical protein M421DRAFT_273905 [Didymella exigua CBS 183.55]
MAARSRPSSERQLLNESRMLYPVSKRLGFSPRRNEVTAREENEGEQHMAGNGGCSIWGRCRQDHHDQIFSACKTIHRDLLLSLGGTRGVKGCCVTLVYRSLLYCGHGPTSYVLKSEERWLDRAAVSVLYSGSTRFYEKVDWTTLPNTETLFSSTPWLQDILGPYADPELRSLSDADV